MGYSILYLLLFMFLLGCVQVVSALGLLATTRHSYLRRHFGIYLGLVGLYLLVLFAMMGGDGFWETDGYYGFGYFYFLSGAFGLAIYHLYILVSHKRRTNKDF